MTMIYIKKVVVAKYNLTCWLKKTYFFAPAKYLLNYEYFEIYELMFHSNFRMTCYQTPSL